MLLSGGTDRWAPEVSQCLWAWVVIKEPVPKPFWLSVSSWTRLCFVYSGDRDGRGASCSSVSGPNWDNRTEVGAEPDGGHGYKIGEHICYSCLTTGSEPSLGAFYNHLPSTSNRWDSVKPRSFRHKHKTWSQAGCESWWSKWYPGLSLLTKSEVKFKTFKLSFEFLDNPVNS